MERITLSRKTQVAILMMRWTAGSFLAMLMFMIGEIASDAIYAQSHVYEGWPEISRLLLPFFERSTPGLTLAALISPAATAIVARRFKLEDSAIAALSMAVVFVWLIISLFGVAAVLSLYIH
jgi:hypothetical protein